MAIDGDNELPNGFMVSEFPTPGIGKVMLRNDHELGPEQHFVGFSVAFQRALQTIGRAPGDYSVKVELTATVHVENPGSVIEYCVKLI
jgi:hypothetical protein